MQNAQPELSRYERKRLEREQKEQERRLSRRKKKIIRWGIFTLVLIVFAGGVVALVRNGDQQNTKEPQSSAQPQAKEIPDLGRAHVSSTTLNDYNSIPPTSGPHFGEQTNWGIHKEPIPEGYQVHNLEHGGVLIQYKPMQEAADSTTGTLAATSTKTEGASEDVVAKLKAIGEDYGWKKLILAPYPPLDANFALTAWTRLDTFDEFDEERIRVFIDAYRNRGPERVPDNMPSRELP